LGIMVFMEALAFAAATAAAAPRIDPAYAVNITVYHVNEHSFGAVPINMNTCVCSQALCVRPAHSRHTSQQCPRLTVSCSAPTCCHSGHALPAATVRMIWGTCSSTCSRCSRFRSRAQTEPTPRELQRTRWRARVRRREQLTSPLPLGATCCAALCDDCSLSSFPMCPQRC
jgi:hypothetical protein